MSFMPGMFPGGLAMARGFAPACLFNGADERMARTPGVATSDRTQFTWNFWIFVNSIPANQVGLHQAFQAANGGGIVLSNGGFMNYVSVQAGSTNGGANSPIGAVVTGVWQNWHIEYDTNLAAGSRVLMWLNGTSVSVTTGTAPTGSNTNLGTTNPHHIGYNPNISSFYDGYMARFHWIDGAIVPISNFGHFEGSQWISNLPNSAFSYDANGFFLDFLDASNLGNDAGPNGVDQTLTNIDSTNYLANGPPRTS